LCFVDLEKASVGLGMVFVVQIIVLALETVLVVQVLYSAVQETVLVVQVLCSVVQETVLVGQVLCSVVLETVQGNFLERVGGC